MNKIDITTYYTISNIIIYIIKLSILRTCDTDTYTNVKK
jgi:hypothetical protein